MEGEGTEDKRQEECPKTTFNKDKQRLQEELHQ